MTVLAQVVDPAGRRVELTIERWEHIVHDRDGHPELSAYIADVMLAVSEPHEQRAGAATTNCGTPSKRRPEPLAAGGRSL